MVTYPYACAIRTSASYIPFAQTESLLNTMAYYETAEQSSDDDAGTYTKDSFNYPRQPNMDVEQARASVLKVVRRWQARSKASTNLKYESETKDTTGDKAAISAPHREQQQSIPVSLKRCMMALSHIFQSRIAAHIAHEVPPELWQEQYTRLQRWTSAFGIRQMSVGL